MRRTNDLQIAGLGPVRRALTRHPAVVDGVVAVLATSAALSHLFTARELGARPPEPIGIMLLTLAGASLLVRRRWPAPVLIAVVALTWGYLARDHPGGAELPLAMVALYTVMAERWRGVGLGVLTILVATHAGYRIGVDGDDPAVVIATLSLLVMAAMLGEGTRMRRDLRAEVRERLRALEVEKGLETRAQLIDERLRIARELHDVLAHTITAISVQASAVADGMDERTEGHAALMTMRSAAREAMQQLRATVSLLRSDLDERIGVAAPDLRGLEDLADTARAAGIDVEVVTDGEPRRLPAAVELTAYRIVQEALTNVIRHAGARVAEVRLAYGAATLEVRVVDDGRGRVAANGSRPIAGRGDGEVVDGVPPSRPRGPAAGHGIQGMRERAAALGGHLRAGEREDGGFEVVASLPTGAVAP